MLWRTIEELVDGEYAHGVYRVEWNARALSSGMCALRIEAGDFVATRKLIVLK